ncbi:hypothetical protein M406DRAFT_331523 [Cryphonectria parasitica EP155]|uniref:SET domain-containing protein n=1 Tax=Cryphonectria parasitica (strain ATCC 38755 / EP155) TaxID=660469 RepID=A0A9P5CN94_CRYP1|nr:uncharacterized protein M406DRAFT_331523 [Cryphonectria parasitica EP155]KAF3765214.1 hypothetical protein M406DRAFT_331523 [Cryphonectria parasitica EP155]
MTAALLREYSGLSPQGKVEFDSCHQHRFENDRRDEEGRLMVILRSNGYTMEDATGRSKVALYPKASLINHSCQPNVLNGDASGTRKIIAMRDIFPGEEISTTYIPLLMDTPNRQARLRQYGFACTCDACRASGLSDHLRIQAGNNLSELQQALTAPIMMKDSGLLLHRAEDLESFFAAQGFGDYLVKTTRLALQYAIRVRNSTAARTWARKHLENLSIIDAESTEAESTREIVMNGI